ncbi:MAG TPA: AI-2E family transporter [Croceibacterium sp.]|nr:AI-2E family transporter [Croceibacterium sp.]
MNASPDPGPGPDPNAARHPSAAAAAPVSPPEARRRTLAFAAQELRLISALVVLLAIGLFLALPFVLSIGAVVFLPLVTAIVLTIILSPLADRLAKLGLPNFLTAFLALVAFLGVLALALTAVLRPALSLFEELPSLIDRIGARFQDLQGNFAWISRLNDRITALAGGSDAEQVVLATPSMLEQLAFATPTVLLEVLLTFLLAFFMIEARVRLRRRMLQDREHLGASVKAARAMRDVQDRVAAYILTVGLINLGVGIVVTAGAWILGLPYPVMWGGLAALLNFLPYIGPLAMAALLTLYGLGTANSAVFGLVPAAAYLGLHTLESNLVTPSILGARFTINPVLILLALSYFSWIWGVVGALLSVPILLTITALIDHLGKPNLIGFIFGEPLFQSNVLELGEDGR